MIAIVEFICICTSILFPAVSNTVSPPPSYEASYTNLGIPLSDHYPSELNSRSIWDMKIYDNKLFVGGGDYDKNTGPVPVYYYDIPNQKWVMSGEVPDEQIEHFFIINNTLMIPGCDPKQSWEMGNIYEFHNDSWNTNRSIPGGIHQFDLAEYNGMIFAGLGVVPGEYPIAVSSDGGKSFRQLTMYKNDVPVDTSIPADEDITAVQIRVYDFFVLNNELYAFYSFYTNLSTSLEIYKYKNDGFYYYCDFPDGISTKRSTYRIFNAEAEYDGKLFITTGNLYATQDLEEVTKIELPDQSAVTDLQLINGKLYALAVAKTSEDLYRTSLWIYSEISDSFREILYFSFSCPAISFTYNQDTLYFGMGSGVIDEECSEIGTVLSVNHSLS